MYRCLLGLGLGLGLGLRLLESMYRCVLGSPPLTAAAAQFPARPVLFSTAAAFRQPQRRRFGRSADVGRNANRATELEAHVVAGGLSYYSRNGTNKDIDLRVKGSVYVALCLSILLHGSEVWCLWEDLLNRLLVTSTTDVLEPCATLPSLRNSPPYFICQPLKTPFN
jgi:hypothetical protein